MKRDLSIILILFMVLSMSTINIKAEDTNNDDLLNDWITLSNNYKQDYDDLSKDIETIKSDLSIDESDLDIALKAYENSKTKFDLVNENYLKEKANKEDIDFSVLEKESLIEEIEKSLNDDISIKKEELTTIENNIVETTSTDSSNLNNNSKSRSCKDVYGNAYIWMGDSLRCRYKVTNTVLK